MKKYHLIGLIEEEAHASLDEHGDITHCSRANCDGESVVMLLIKKPGGGWGQNINSTAACALHESDLDNMIAKVTKGGKS